MLFKKEPTYTEHEIEVIYDKRRKCDPLSDDYKVYNDRLRELLEMKDMENKPKFRISPDTMLKTGAFVIVCGLVIFKEELFGPISSKAFSLVSKIIA